ncbi:MAG: hypothetical protein QOI89_2358 [Solirubrobacteraceae bacterium]|jgi:hypothetical protein|nr:hypothetical protein [Solirubrobacteraceae bacterium]
MISDPQLIDVVQPVVAALLDFDARALAQVAARRDVYANMDAQPAATAMALERRAVVATQLRKEIAPGCGWELITEHLESGAYEWLAGKTLVRLSKTNRESRLEDVRASLGLQGVQDTLFDTAAQAGGPRDEILIRLMGNALHGASVDAVALGARGQLGTPIPLRTIAEMQVQRVVPATAPKPRITVPGLGRTEDSSG